MDGIHFTTWKRIWKTINTPCLLNRGRRGLFCNEIHATCGYFCEVIGFELGGWVCSRKCQRHVLGRVVRLPQSLMGPLPVGWVLDNLCSHSQFSQLASIAFEFRCFEDERPRVTD